MLRRFWFRVRQSLGGRRAYGDIREELEFHVEMEARSLRERGVPEAEALRQARARLGGVEHYTERAFRAPGFDWLDDARQDLRVGLRQLLRTPGFTAVLVLTLALGIGATTAMYTVVDAVLLEPLPYPEADGLVQLWVERDGRQQPSWMDGHLVDLQSWSRAFESVGRTQGPLGWHLSGNGRTDRVQVMYANDSFFRVLGVEPHLGRWYVSEDGFDAAVLSFGTWEQSYGADPDIVGTSVVIHGDSYQVIGVAPPGFEAPGTAEGIAVYRNLPDRPDPDRVWFRNRAFARLAPGVSLEQARQELVAFGEYQRTHDVEWQRGDLRAGLDGLKDTEVATIRPTLRALFAAAVVVLLVACANVANLLLVRAERRRRETAVRLAIGAGRFRLVRQHLAEGLLLVVAGGGLGVLMAEAGLPLALALRPDDLTGLDMVRVDGTVLAVTAIAAVLCVVLFSIAPAWTVRAASPSRDLARRAGSLSESSRGLGTGLVVLEVALCVMLLGGTGLLSRSVSALRAEDPGFRTAGALTAFVELPGSRYDRAASGAFFPELEARLAALPGVEAVGSAWPLPLQGSFTVGYGLTEAERQSDDRPVAQYQMVTEGYAEAMGVRLVEGRFLRDDDPRGAVVVDSRFAERAWPGRSAVGERVSVAHWGGPGEWATVVGVVEHVRYSGLRSEGRETVYLLWSAWAWVNQGLTVVLRTDQPVEAVARPFRDAVADLDPALPVDAIVPISTIVAGERAHTRFAAALGAAFAGVTALLAGIGLYGLLGYRVAGRRSELSLRMALGAGRSSVYSLVLTGGLKLVVAGLALGLIGYAVAARLLTSLLFGIEPTDPVTVAGVVALILGVAVIATTVPARRAALVDPARALQAD